MSRFAVFVTGDPISSVGKLTPDFGALIRAIAGDLDASWIDIDLREVNPLPDPAAFAACIITGSPHSVMERAAWMLQAEAYLRHARECGTALFGICFGHQLMASAFGGTVAINPRGREMGVCVAEPSECQSASVFPQQAIRVHMSHRDSVVAVPRGARVLLQTRREPHAALAYGDLCCSTQFHPEFTPAILRCYIEHYRAELAAQGDDVHALLSQIRETPRARQLLRNFVEAVIERDRLRSLRSGAHQAAQ